MFLGLDVTAWTAILALATVLLAVVTVWLAVTDRRRDDSRRTADRERDDDLRAQALADIQRREDAERRAKEDYEARQVVVTVGPALHAYQATMDFLVTIPLVYPVKQVEARIAVPESAGFSIVGADAGEPPRFDNQAVTYQFRSSMREEHELVIRWVDWHGNRYYQFRHYTERFGENIDWLEAVTKIDGRIRRGPEPG